MRFLGPSWRSSSIGYVIILLAAFEQIMAVVHGKEINWNDFMIHFAAGTAFLVTRDNKTADEGGRCRAS